MTTVTKIEKKTDTSWIIELSNGEFAVVKRQNTADALYRLVSDIAQLPTLSRFALIQLNQKIVFFTLISTNNETIGNIYCQHPTVFGKKQNPILLETNVDVDSLQGVPREIVFESSNSGGFCLKPVSIYKDGNTVTFSTVKHFYVFKKMYK